ncbi:sensor histidine kinase [Nostoc sp. FACHB-87]|uniref:sensor histidine kinase n=1 Tax=Nostocaceae TaxID=1162 RepID=UPI0016823803|nr:MULTISPECIES: ATP-binding protein [Nostocaceae]MBD2452960.1 sensor histidine kinase [Nostoc sp. FACHB-87]MBD2474858.1 sensor histidine kinase [Anabaena sp. FACHB-83]
MQDIDYDGRLKELEKTVRVLQRKLDRSEADRQQLENASEVREAVLKNVIRELEASQIALENRGQELETILGNLKALQIKLVESEKMSAIGVLVAGIAHEINNPVSFIYGNLNYAHKYFQDVLDLLEIYQKHYPNPAIDIQQKIKAIELEFIQEDAHKLFQSMMCGAERICEIVKSLRTFSRLDEAEFKTVNIHDGIDSTLVILNNRFKASSNKLSDIQIIRNYEKLPLVECYAGQLNQVFMNILANATDALEEAVIKKRCTQENFHPTIEIETKVINHDWVEISIADNGLGIAETVQTKLFDPFFTTKDIGKGTGLGLSISYKIIVELHRGQLECHSTPGTGAKFIIQIPIRQSQNSALNN